VPCSTPGARPARAGWPPYPCPAINAGRCQQEGGAQQQARQFRIRFAEQGGAGEQFGRSQGDARAFFEAALERQRQDGKEEKQEKEIVWLLLENTLSAYQATSSQ
jgi:hypothetical protein